MVGTRTGGLWVVLMDLLTSQETASVAHAAAHEALAHAAAHDLRADCHPCANTLANRDRPHVQPPHGVLLQRVRAI